MVTDIDLDRCADALRTLSDDLARTGPRSPRDGSPANLIGHARDVSARAAHALRAHLADLHPEIGWTDEDGRLGDRDYWLYDPIDGAYHFLQGLPLWSSSLALVRQGRPVLSFVYDPKGGELFVASDRGGATCNGAPLAVSAKSDVAAAVVGTAIPPLAQVGDAEHAEALSMLGAASRAVFVVRPMAAVSLQLAYVAAGRLDAYWENGRDAGDWLAGSLLVREAGGAVTHLNGETFGRTGEGIVAGGGALHAALHRALHAARAAEPTLPPYRIPTEAEVGMTPSVTPITRRTLLGTGLATVAAASLPIATNAQENTMSTQVSAWPNDARLAVSFSLMFEAGGQPISGAGGVIPDPIRDGLPDLPTNAFFQYGVYEGVPRILDLMDKHGVKLSSFMIGRAVEKAPDLAKEIVRRGHEAAAHGRTWENSYFLDADAEHRFIADSVESIAKATGQQPRGWNAYWMRNSVRTLDILQRLGFTYHIDEPSRDEPFIVPLKGGDFVTVPYTFHMNDIVSFPFEGWNAAAYEQALRDEFDQLYEEGVTRRRMMVVSLHDRISGHANRVRALDCFLTYAKSKPGVWFARKDEIAAWALQHRGHTQVMDRGPAGVSGLPGSAA